jgi:hypothetical protein
MRGWGASRRGPAEHGREGDLMKWREMLNSDCPSRHGRLNDRCDLMCPDLPKLL